MYFYNCTRDFVTYVKVCTQLQKLRFFAKIVKAEKTTSAQLELATCTIFAKIANFAKNRKNRNSLKEEGKSPTRTRDFCEKLRNLQEIAKNRKSWKKEVPNKPSQFLLKLRIYRKIAKFAKAEKIEKTRPPTRITILAIFAKFAKMANYIFNYIMQSQCMYFCTGQFQKQQATNYTDVNSRYKIFTKEAPSTTHFLR